MGLPGLCHKSSFKVGFAPLNSHGFYILFQEVTLAKREAAMEEVWA